jgi:hypothetical protein
MSERSLLAMPVLSMLARHKKGSRLRISGG